MVYLHAVRKLLYKLPELPKLYRVMVQLSTSTLQL